MRDSIYSELNTVLTGKKNFYSTEVGFTGQGSVTSPLVQQSSYARCHQMFENIAMQHIYFFRVLIDIMGTNVQPESCRA